MRSYLALIALLVGAVGQSVFYSAAGGQTATPEIFRIEVADDHGEVAFLMRAELGSTGTFVGLALICSEGDPDGAKVVAFFGGFPWDRRPVQLAVRGSDGVVERFGPVVSGGPESGFHSPELFDVEEAKRFVTAAMSEGALVSNGYRSFWNRVSEERNDEIRKWFLDCSGSGATFQSGRLKKPARLGLQESFLNGIMEVLVNRFVRRIMR